MKTLKDGLTPQARWDKKHKNKRQYINKRSATKAFILNMADREDLDDIKDYLEIRTKELQ